MAEQNPTVIITHLNDEQLRKSIDSLVGYVDEKFKAMTTSTTSAVSTIQKELQKLGSLNAQGAGGGELGITKALQRAKQEAKESSVTFDQMSASMQKATTGNGNKTIFSTMDTEIAILKERLVEAKSQVESFTVMARRGAETGDKGLFTFSTENLHKYEAEVEKLTQQINSLTSQRQALKEMLNPQGDAFKNYVDSLTKVNPELAALNAQYKDGKSLLQQQTNEVKRRNQEEQNGGRTAKEIAQDQKRYIEQNRKSEQARKQATIETGIAAQQTARTIVASMQAQSQANVDNNIDKPITGYKELEKVIKDMRSAYAAMSDEQKKSQDGLNLQYSIDQAKKAKQAVEEYNREIAGMGISSRKNVGYQSDSYAALSKQLSNTVKGFQNLSGAKRDAEQGTAAINKIHQLRLALREIQNQMNRPISLSKAMGLEENTLDRIAYKIQQLNAYRGGLNITDHKQVGEMRTVENEIDRLKKKQDELMGKNQQLMNSNNALARSWNYMKNRLAFYFTVGASTQFVKNLIEVRSQYEMNERALGILIDSAERGTQIFNELSQMALVSPYTLIELSTAAKQLSAYDIAAKDVVDTTRRLADISAAVGVPVERFTYALGQVKAFGHLTSQDARQFLNTGVPLVKELAKHYTELEGRLVSTADVYDRMKKKAISYNDVMQVITEMTDEGGKFFDFQAKMADTLKVQLANLTLAWNNMLNEIGKSEQGVLVGGIKGLKELFLQWEKINTLVRNLAITLGLAKLLQVIQIATLGMDAFGKKMVWQILVGKKLQVVLYNIAGSLKAIVTSPLTWWALLATAVVSAGMALYDANKALKEFNKSIADGGKENYENTKKFLQQYQDLRNELQIKNGTLKDGRTTPAAGVSKDEAEKAWVAIREQIELTSQSSDYFIGKLLSIDDVNKRVEKGFDYLQKIQDVYGAMSSMDDDTIAIKETYNDWWNLGLAQDGVIGNLKEYIATKKLAEEEEKKGAAWHETETVFARRIKGLWSSADIALQQYRSDLDVTLESMANFAQTQGFDFDQEKEFFSQTINKIVTQRNLGEREALQFRLDAEERYKDARIKQFDEVIEFETKRAGEAAAGAEKDRLLLRVKAAQQEKAAWLANQEEMYGEGCILFEGFTKYMTRNHGSELQKLFGNMTKKEIEQINWSEPRWKKWAEDNAKAFAEQFGVSFDKLKKYVNDANRMTIFIRTIVQKPDDKSVYETLTEADKAADEAWNKIQRLKTHKGELESKGAIVAGTRDIDTDYANTIQEITDAQKDYNDALAKGGHSKKENTTNTKAQKQAETELQKALKDELSLLDKVRSQYKKLTDACVDGTTALNMVTNQFTNSIQRINNILGRNGLPLFNIKAFAGTDNPNAVLEMLKKQLDAAKVAKNIKPSEIKELEVKYGEIVIDAKVYNTKKITDGLNNELSKIKDEYELAVELDANPELGNIFTDMFGIDTTDFPKTIDEYMQRVQDEFDKGREKFNYQTPLNVFKATESDWIRWGASVGIVTAKLDEQGNIMADDTTALDKFKAKFVDAQGVAKKWATDIVNNTKKLEYDLAELNDKIAIKEKEQARLHEQIENEKNEVTKHYLELTYQNNQKAIDELKSQALSLMPEYARVFNSIAEHSAGVARRLQRDLMKVYDSAVFDSASNSWTLTSGNGTKTKLSDTQYRKEREKLTKEMRKSQSNFQKIKEAFKPSDKDGVVDYAKGIELIAEETRKAADGLHTVADIVSYIGGSDDAVETLNDIATSMEGVSTAAQGIVQIQNKDYIGGAVNVLKGTWQAVSTWFDNSDKRISNEIANSERQVRRLELAYIDLEHAINDAYGTETIGAQKAAIANKELQLAELKRQLTLEQSRKKKNQDKDRIIELQKQIKELEYDIKSMTDEIVNDLLGISSVGDAMESLMDSFIEALRSGEDAMAVFDDSIDNMIANMVKKMFTTKILQPWFENQWDLIQKDIDERVGKELPKKIAQLTGQVDTAKRANLTNRDSVWEALASMGLSAEQIHQYESYDTAGNYIFDASKRFERRKELYEKMLDDKEKALDAAQREYTELTTPTVDDIKKWAVLLRSGDITVEQWQGYLDGLLTDLDLMKDSKDKTLSNLQQGIRGVTEETAGAIEAYMNGVSQQVYYHSSLLEQIRDSVAGFDIDVQTASLSQILLQLQTNYIVMQSMQSIMEGWTIPSGQGIRVELIS